MSDCSTSNGLSSPVDLGEACVAEVVELHAFFVSWMTGQSPSTDAAYGRFIDVLDDAFAIVSPRGVITKRTELIGELRAAHGGQANTEFRIWIEQPAARRLSGDLWLVTYEEWQNDGVGQINGRLSSALFTARAGMPNGVAWLHVHETWLPDPAP